MKRWHPEMGGSPMPEPKVYYTWAEVAEAMMREWLDMLNGKGKVILRNSG